MKRSLDGTIAKNRYCVAGELTRLNGEVHALTAEVDEITSISVPFVTIDVERPSPDFLEDFRAGNHTFSFLHDNCLELSAQDKKLRSFLNMKHLARCGYDVDAQKAADHFLQILAH